VSGQVKEHGSAVVHFGTWLRWCPLSTGKTSNTILIFCDLHECNSWTQPITHSVEVFCIPAMIWGSVARHSSKFLISHDLFELCLLFRVIGALRFIKNFVDVWIDRRTGLFLNLIRSNFAFFSSKQRRQESIKNILLTLFLWFFFLLRFFSLMISFFFF
jgi:hypothetical protein